MAFDLLDVLGMVNIPRDLSLPLLAAIVTAVVLALGSCEDNSELQRHTPPTVVVAPEIDPDIVRLSSTNTFATLQVAGGTPPYIWSVSDPSLGSVPDTGAFAITYTRTAGKSGVNLVTAADRNGWSAEALVYQE